MGVGFGFRSWGSGLGAGVGGGGSGGGGSRTVKEGKSSRLDLRLAKKKIDWGLIRLQRAERKQPCRLTTLSLKCRTIKEVFIGRMYV